MVDLKPFRGLRYDPTKAGALDTLLAPPFDVIPNGLRQELLRRCAYNVVHLTLAGEIGGDWHESAALRFRNWRREGILRQDEEPSFYAYEHRFEWNGVPTQRLGLIGILRLEEEDEQEVYPHEHTFPRAREDRLKLLSACRANLEPIFLLFSDPEGEVSRAIRKERRVDLVESSGQDETGQAFWRLADPEAIRTIREIFSDKKLLVADGHHRFATAKDFRDAEWARTGHRDRAAAYNYRMIHLSYIEDPALRILPTHRTLNGLAPEALEGLADALAPFYELRREDREIGELAQPLVEAGNTGPEIIVYTGRTTWCLYPRSDDTIRAAMGRDRSPLWSSLPSARLHRLILEDVLGITAHRLAECVTFHRSAVEAASRVDRREAQAAFLLRAVKPQVIWELSRAGEMMPQKSTDFFPKFPSGFIFYAFE